MVLVVCERPAERRREDAKGGSAPPSPPQQGSPPPCKAKFPLERKNWDKKLQGKDSPQFADCDVQQLWCCLLLGEDEASDERESSLIA